MKGKNLSRGLSKILSVLLSLVLIFGALPMNALAAPKTGDFYLRSSSIGTDNFVIATTSGNNAMRSNFSGTAVTVDSHNIITTNPIPTDAIWAISSAGSGKYYIMSGTQYLITNSGNIGLGTKAQADASSNTNGQWSYSSNVLTVSYYSYYTRTNYLRYSSGFSLSTSSGTSLYLYQDTDLALSNLAFASHPSKTSYTEGDYFDPTGMSLTASYNDYSTETVGPSDCTYSPALTAQLSPSDTSVTINYGTQHVSQTITVATKTVTSIEITKPPTTTIYDEGQTFDSSGMVVTAHYSNGTSAPVTGYSVTPSGSLTPLNHSVTISFGGQTTTQDITVNALVLDSIAITTHPNKTSYIEGQSFDPAGMVVTATFTNGSHAAITGYTCSPSTNLATTDTQVTVTYNGKQDIQPITVAAKALDHITIANPPSKTTYVVGQSFSAAGMVVNAFYNNSTSEPVTGYTFDTSPLATGTTKVTISYTYSSVTKTADQSITVIAKALDHIAITTPPTKTAYVVGQTFDPTNMVVTATYNDETSAPVTGFTYSPTRTLLTTDTKVTVSYGGKSVDQSITVTIATNAETPTINADTPVGWIAVDIGSTASLSVTASVSKGVLTYQWYSNTTNVNTGGTAVGTSSSDPTLTLNTAAASTTFYYCVVTNTDTTATGSQTATATSNVGEVVVRRDAQTPNIVSTSPANMSVYQNSSSSITVAAYIDSGSLTYQWYTDTTGLNSGGTAVGTLSTSPTLTLNTSTAGTSYYYCVVTNTDYDAPGLKTATATSRAARVIVSAATSGTLLLTFDDGWSDQYTRAYPILDAKGFKGTAYVNSEFIGQESGYMSLSQAQALYAAGWDIANHTTNHEDVGVGDQTDASHIAQLKAMYCDCATWLTSNGMPRAAYHAAYPSGLYSQDLIRLLKLNGFKTGRATMFGLQSAIQDQNDYFTLPVYSLGDTNDLQACLDGIDQAAASGSTLIIMIHKVEPSSGDLVTLTSWLQQIVDKAKTQVDAHKLQVMTMSQWFEAQGVVGAGETPPAPNVTGNDATNTVSGLNQVMEYKLDNAASYTMYDPTAFLSVHLAGDHTLAVRYAAAGADPAGPDTILTFTKVLQSITLTPPTKTAYVEGTTFDPAGMVVTAHYDDLSTGAVTGYTIDPAGALTTANTKVTVSYTYAGITKTIDQPITVSKMKLASITITAPPTKTAYIEGNAFDPAGMIITANYDNGTSEVVTGYTTAPTGQLAITDTKVTVSYTYAGLTKTTDQPITVSPKALDHIAVTSPPTKTTYIEGNIFNAAGMVVTAYYDNDTSAAVTGYSIDPSGALATTDTKVTISYIYAGVTRTYNQPITVNAKALDHIAITAQPTQKVYIEGNFFNSTGMVVTAYYDNGTNEDVIGYSIAPSGALATTDTKVIVSYTFASVTKTIDQQITVHPKSLVRIEITTPPSKLTYVEGETFNTSGMVVTAYYDNDTSAVVTGYSVDPAGPLSAATVKVTVSYTYVSVTKTADQPVAVLVASLDHIAITAPPSKTTYIEGQTFDSSGMVVTAYYNNGTSSAVTGYTIAPSGELATTDTKVTISYSAKTTDQTITVNAKKLSSIAITSEPTKKTYIEGTLFDPSGMVVTAYYDNGKNEAVAGYTIAPSGELATTDTKVTVSYTFAGLTKTAVETITVNAKKLSSIAITTPPTKVTYIEGNIFSAAGMVVTAYYDNGKSEAIPGYTIAPSGELATTDSKVTVSYTYEGLTKTADQTILVNEKALSSIAITTPPTKTIYIEGNIFDRSGMVVTAYYNNGKSEAVTGYITTPTTELATTNTKITVSYDYKGILTTADQSITVNPKSLDHIAITAEPTQKVYIEGNTFNSAGMVVTAYYDNGTHEDVLGYTITPSGTLATTDTKVTVSYTYKGLAKMVDQTIAVHAKSLTRIEITTPPTKVTYIEGNTFSTAGMVITAYYDNDTSAVVTGYSIDPSGALAASDVKVTISYTYVGVKKTVEQLITVSVASLDHIAITAPPSKTTYIEGQTFDPSGMVVTAYNNNGTSSAVTGYTIAPSGELATTDTKVTVSYGGKTADQIIEVNAKKLSSIAITTEPNERTYVEGNLFDPAGMVVTAYYDNGKNEAVIGYTINPSGQLATTDTKVTVSYTFAGITKAIDQQITVSAASLDHISITAPPSKTIYIEGNPFDPASMVITAYYNNGTSEAVTGYITTPSGDLATTDTKVTVSYTYKGVTKTADQAIIVNAKKLTDIAITTAPSNTQYIESQTFDKAGMVVTAYYDNGKNETVTGYTINPSGQLATTDTKVTVSFAYAGVTKTADQPITVVLKSLNHIVITTEPTKKAYIEGNVFDPAGMVVTAYFDNGTYAAVTGYSIIPSVALSTTDTKVTVNYGGKTADQAITVAAKSLDRIAITSTPIKTQYVEGQAFESAGMAVTAYYNNGTSGLVGGFTWKPDAALATTDTKVTVSFIYGGVTKTAEQSITVTAKAITGLNFKTHPTTTDYMEGQTFDPAGMVLTATYNDGSSKEVLPGDCTFSINRPLQVADTYIDVIYDSMRVTQDITVFTSAQLKDITATAGTLSPTFDPNIKGYTLLLGEYTANTTIRPVLADASSLLYINGKKASSKTFTLLNAKQTNVTIKVQPKTGKAITYTVTVKRAASTNASLAYIKASKGSLTEVNLTNYTVNLSNIQTSTTFSLKLADKTAKYTMTLDGKKTTSKTVSMKPGTTRTLVITVTPQAGSAYAVTYTVTIVRAVSHNDNLAALKPSKGVLAPAFDPALTGYTLALASNSSSTKLTVKLADTTAKYSITIGGKKSGSTISLAKGVAKAVTITVTSQAGDIKIYTVTITRAS